MKSKNDLALTYMGNLQRAWYASETADTQEIHHLLEGFKNFNGPMYQSLPLFFVIDYSAQQYLVMTDALESISGYHPRDFIEARLGKLMDVFHKDDFAIYNQQIFAANAAFLKSTPQQEHSQYVFSYSFRFMHRNKKTVQALQRGQYITSKQTGLPLYSLGMVMDISDVKTDRVMMHTIEKSEQKNGMWSKQIIQQNYFYPDMDESVLTRREKVVLLYICDGYSSKQIADKLYISESTVVNHKQNMLRKTNTKNTAELVAFCLRNRIV